MSVWTPCSQSEFSIHPDHGIISKYNHIFQILHLGIGWRFPLTYNLRPFSPLDLFFLCSFCLYRLLTEKHNVRPVVYLFVDSTGAASAVKLGSMLDSGPTWTWPEGLTRFRAVSLCSDHSEAMGHCVQPHAFKRGKKKNVKCHLNNVLSHPGEELIFFSSFPIYGNG